MQRFAALALCAALLTNIVPVAAHNEYRIIGTIASVTAKRLDIKQAKDGKIISMAIDAETLVTRDKKKVSRAELKAGQYVVADACGDSVKDLLAMEVRLVPAPTTKKQR